MNTSRVRRNAATSDGASMCPANTTGRPSAMRSSFARSGPSPTTVSSTRRLLTMSGIAESRTSNPFSWIQSAHGAEPRSAAVLPR